MASPVKLNFKIYQGSTFKEVLRWETSTKVYKAISSITKAAPIVVTAVGHGIPTGWRTKVTNVSGMKEINSAETYHTVTANTADSVTINAVNSLAYTDYVSGGVLEYNEPCDLTGITARMQIREKITSATTLIELTTENGKIVIDNTFKTITLVLSATDTSAFTFSSAVYSLELINGTEVTPFIFGSISLTSEITR
jgi:hypothetical protein